jgi:hypothetical protein
MCERFNKTMKQDFLKSNALPVQQLFDIGRPLLLVQIVEVI